MIMSAFQSAICLPLCSQPLSLIIVGKGQWVRESLLPCEAGGFVCTSALFLLTVCVADRYMEGVLVHAYVQLFLWQCQPMGAKVQQDGLCFPVAGTRGVLFCVVLVICGSILFFFPLGEVIVRSAVYEEDSLQTCERRHRCTVSAKPTFFGSLQNSSISKMANTLYNTNADQSKYFQISF